MNRRAHAMLARLLIEACGGLEESARACRVQKSQLSDYQAPAGELFMPADVMFDLERYCGRPIYSRALLDQHERAQTCANLLGETMEVTEAAAVLMRKTRLALADGELTPRERDDLVRQGQTALQELADVMSILERPPK